MSKKPVCGAAGVLAYSLLAACYDPGGTEGLPCIEATACDPGQVCVEGFCRLAGDSSITAAFETDGDSDSSGDGDGDSSGDGDGDSSGDGDGDSSGDGDGDSSGDGDGDSSGDGDGDSSGDGDGDSNLPDKPNLELAVAQTKTFDFSWSAVAGADWYRLYERASLNANFILIADDIVEESLSLVMPLHLRADAAYRLQACNRFGCTDDDDVDVMGTLAEAVGYFKASNPDEGDSFGRGLALSGDGTVLAVGAHGEESNAMGINGDDSNNSAIDAGAVYVFHRDQANSWMQLAYIKASNSAAFDGFGVHLAISADGTTLAVGAAGESSSATGINADQWNNNMSDSGAVYVFVYDNVQGWTQQAYLKASNTGAGDLFGHRLTLSHSGDILAVSARREDSSAQGVNANQSNDNAADSGAVYVFERGNGVWAQYAYIKASNTNAEDNFGESLALSFDGATLAVGADAEQSTASGVNGSQADNSGSSVGAVYVYRRQNVNTWTQQAYIKPSNSTQAAFFGCSVALSNDGNTLAAGSEWESNSGTGVDAPQFAGTAYGSGAVYVFQWSAMGGWAQQAYIKSSNADAYDLFGAGVALSADGDILGASASEERSNSSGINGNPFDNSVPFTGAVYMFERDGGDTWSEVAYVKASNTTAEDADLFGESLVMSAQGDTLAICAPFEDGGATGVNGNQNSISTAAAGAVYLY